MRLSVLCDVDVMNMVDVLDFLRSFLQDHLDLVLKTDSCVWLLFCCYLHDFATFDRKVWFGDLCWRLNFIIWSSTPL